MEPLAFNPSASGVRARVFYALVELEQDKQKQHDQLKGRIGAEVRQLQLLLSIQSLRIYDKEIPVHVITYGRPLPELAVQLRSLGAEMIYAGGYFDAVENILPGSGPFLEGYPVLAKFLALPHMSERPAQQLLYVDCDTVFLGPPFKLFDACQDADFYAREEGESERSHEETNIIQVDDTLCRIVQQRLGIQRPCQPMNTGVILYNNSSWARLSNLLGFFLQVLLSFCNFLVQNYPVKKFPDKQLQYCKDHQEGLARLVDNSALPYPALNLWTREQFAAVVTFATANLEQRDFQHDQVLQDCEELAFSKPSRPVISHYLSDKTHKFCQRVAPQFYPELNVELLRKASQAQWIESYSGGVAIRTSLQLVATRTSLQDGWEKVD